ncbi:unnamed protein product [Adineta ricciae]|uniref:Uncharacterized protein n=1 Tax=Adineta ricciae TaxID=249248 RepID=A0A815K9S1_ADIRI|nr:unnamed protein product [Adineta ricciae]CAF1392762.1 unnamed protein product [Adineta ricciae]
MRYYLTTLLICTVTHLLTSSDAIFNNNDSESIWSTGKGNAQNTYRIVPSMATNYSKIPWTYEYNATSQDLTQFGRGVGINANFMVCLTSNGIVRWTLSFEPVETMEPAGVSNIISDRQGVLFYTISWAGDRKFTAKLCQITNAQTSQPVQQCIENYQLFMSTNAPLALNEKYDLLVTAVEDNKIDSIPAVLDKKTLKLLWTNRRFFGAGRNGQYRCDTSTGDIFWIGGDTRLLKFDHSGKNLINNYTDAYLSGIDFVLDKQRQIIVQPWQNASSLPWKLVVSSYDVSAQQIKLRWSWCPPSSIGNNDGITSPAIDEQGTAYMSSMPLAFAIDSQGKTVWTTQLATSSEMKTFELYSTCVAMNSKRRVLYIVSVSQSRQGSKSLCFITAVSMDTGKVIERINLNLTTNEQIIPQCPILVGDEMLYFSWLTGEYPELVPLKVMGIQQV